VKYCPIDLSKSALQMMDSALTAGAAVTAATTDSSWNGTCNQSKENQEEQEKQGSEHDSQASEQLVFATCINNIAEALLCPLCKRLPRDPVVRNDGRICERSELECRRNTPREHVGALDKFIPSMAIEKVIRFLISCGQVDEKYLPNKEKYLASNANENDSISFIKASAEEGDTDSMVVLGEKYLKGQVVEKEETTAYSWFHAASEQGSELGTVRKADCLLMGIGAAQDCEQAKCLLLQAASEDDSGKF
jgi:hypothetical protein